MTLIPVNSTSDSVERSPKNGRGAVDRNAAVFGNGTDTVDGIANDVEQATL